MRVLWEKQLGRALEDRFNEHKRASRLINPGHSAVAEHAIDILAITFDGMMTHFIDFVTNLWPRKVKEATGNQLWK